MTDVNPNGIQVREVGLYDENGSAIDTANPLPTTMPEAVSTNTHTGEKELRVFSAGHVCTDNTTTTPLGINGLFTGAWQDTLDYSEIIVTIYADKNSTTNGLKILWSIDGVTADPDPDTFTITANVSKTFSFPCNRRFVKITYQNDGTAQTVMLLSTVLKRFASKGSSHRLEDTLNSQDDAIVTKTLIAGKTTAQGGAIVDVKVNPSGTLTVDATGSDVTATTTRAKSWYNDGFQSLRTSQKNKRFDHDFHAGKSPLLWDEVGNGVVTFDANSRDVVISIPGTALTDKMALIQHYYNIYTPLYSQIIAETGVINGANLAGTFRGFLRSTVTGVTTEQYLTITPGTIDFSKSLIYLMDFQSLRVGLVRYGLDRNGEVSELGEIANDNIRATGYWQTPNLPSQYRVYNTAENTITEIMYGDEYNAIGYQFVSALNASQTCRAICVGVASEGGGDLLNLDGTPFTTPILSAKTVTNTLAPILSIRVASLFNSLTNRGLVIPKSFELQTDNPIEYVIYYRPSLTGASWNAINATYHGVEYDDTATIVSGGMMIKHGLLSSGTNQTARAVNLLGKIIMSLGSAGVADIVTLAAVRTGATNATVKSVLEGIEVR